VKIGLRAALLLPIRLDGRLDSIVSFQSKTPRPSPKTTC
jgi:hypothetical protein